MSDSVTVDLGGLASDADAVLAENAGVAAKLAAGDDSLWGPDAQSEASIRLGWLRLPESSRELLPRLTALREQLAQEGLDRVVLSGMGGSSLAPEVITRTEGKALVILDTTDPGQIRAAMQDLERTVVVISSKSGTTVETDSHRRAFLQAFTDPSGSGLSAQEAGKRFVMVTDPGSPLEEIGKQMGARDIVLADPNVGGRYSALTAFGLVPAALAGADVARLLDDAAALSPALAKEQGNPGLALGAALGAAYKQGRDKIVLATAGGEVVGLGDWAEQLIAESTGKDGTGLLPVVVESADAPGTTGPDVLTVTVEGEAGAGVTVRGPLGAQFLAWEYAVAFAGRVIGINPFDQPNVTESKDNTKRILSEGLPQTTPAATYGAVEVYGPEALLAGTTVLSDAVAALMEAVPERGYLAVMAYLDRLADRSAADLRAAIARRCAHAVTFGWGPRFLHSTGQYHKGGAQVGAFLQITGAVPQDLDVPDQPYSFADLQAAQAAGDLQALTGRDRPVLRLHLTDRSAGLGQLLEAIS